MIDIVHNSDSAGSKQKTILKPVEFSGVGLHSGAKVVMKIEPAKEDSGIKFIRTDIKNQNEIKANWSNVSSTNLSTTISNQSSIKVSTIDVIESR